MLLTNNYLSHTCLQVGNECALTLYLLIESTNIKRVHCFIKKLFIVLLAKVARICHIDKAKSLKSTIYYIKRVKKKIPSLYRAGD
jgi:hypothetical protein